MDKTNPEDIASWLGRETGHTPEADEGYEGEVQTEDEGFGLPNPKHEKLRRFFDGIDVEKQLTAKRRATALSQVDEAEKMNQALMGAIPPGGEAIR